MKPKKRVKKPVIHKPQPLFTFGRDGDQLLVLIVTSDTKGAVSKLNKRKIKHTITEGTARISELRIPGVYTKEQIMKILSPRRALVDRQKKELLRS